LKLYKAAIKSVVESGSKLYEWLVKDKRRTEAKHTRSLGPLARRTGL